MGTGAYYFLEVNTRLQVEHGVTEQVTGLDLVELMIPRSGRGIAAARHLRVEPTGWSIEARIYAEDPAKNFQPAPGKLDSGAISGCRGAARVETWVENGTEITPFYDPMIAKIIVTGADRADAVCASAAGSRSDALYGTETNLRYLRAVAACETFRRGRNDYVVSWQLSPHRGEPFEVLDGGTQTTIQDYPGRLGYWHVGVPPSGPMDALAFRIANRSGRKHRQRGGA